jgi:hypothetical protein
MIRLIRIEHIPLQRLREIRKPRLLAGILTIFGEAGIFENCDHVVVPRDEPCLANAWEDGQTNLANRLLRPQPCIGGEGIRFEFGADQIDRRFQTSRDESGAGGG